MFPIVWNAVNTNMNPNPNKITFKNFRSMVNKISSDYLNVYETYYKNTTTFFFIRVTLCPHCCMISTKAFYLHNDTESGRL